MTSGITADTSALSQSGQQFAAVADELRLVGETLAGTLAGLGDFWGNDQFGQAFASKYVDPATKFFDFAGVAGDTGVPGVADAINSWSNTYSDAVQQEVDAVRPLYDGITG